MNKDFMVSFIILHTESVSSPRIKGSLLTTFNKSKLTVYYKETVSFVSDPLLAEDVPPL